MSSKEEIKVNTFQKILTAKNASATNMTGVKDLLSAMSAVNNQNATPETEKPRKAGKAPWRQIFMVCCCILAIAAAGKAFLYLDTEISAAVKELGTLEAQLATTDTKGQLAAVTAEMKDLKATNAQLRAEVQEIRDTLEALKARQNNVVPAQRKRR